MHFHVLELGRVGVKFGYLEREDSNSELNYEPAPTCKHCGTGLRSREILPPFRYVLLGKRPGDFLTDGLRPFFSERFVKRYTQSDLTGLTFAEEPLVLGGIPTNYRLGVPAATTTRLHETASGVVVDDLRGCDTCRVMAIHRMDRLVVDEETWDGQDIFTMGNLFNVIVVSDRFFDFVQAEHCTNFLCTHQDAFCFDFGF